LGKEKVVSSTEEGWRAFMEMGEDGLGSKLHNASEEHDKIISALCLQQLQNRPDAFSRRKHDFYSPTR